MEFSELQTVFTDTARKSFMANYADQGGDLDTIGTRMDVRDQFNKFAEVGFGQALMECVAGGGLLVGASAQIMGINANTVALWTLQFMGMVDPDENYKMALAASKDLESFGVIVNAAIGKARAEMRDTKRRKRATI
jgi:hypothetical protein